MPNRSNTIRAYLILAALFFALTLPLLSSCAAVKKFDETFWKAPAPVTNPVTPTSQPAAPTAPAPATSVAELVGALLAAGGFGGMATWLRRIKKQNNGQVRSLDRRIQDLEARRTFKDILEKAPEEN